MRKVSGILFIFSIGLFGFLLLNKQYALTAYQIPFFSVPNGHVRVDFVNKSDENIKSILLIPEMYTIENLTVNERRTFTYKHSGEGTYQFIVTFDSGKQIKEDDRYIEGGYFLIENIYNTEVKTGY